MTKSNKTHGVPGLALAQPTVKAGLHAVEGKVCLGLRDNSVCPVYIHQTACLQLGPSDVDASCDAVATWTFTSGLGRTPHSLSGLSLLSSRLKASLTSIEACYRDMVVKDTGHRINPN